MKQYGHLIDMFDDYEAKAEECYKLDRPIPDWIFGINGWCVHLGIPQFTAMYGRYKSRGDGREITLYSDREMGALCNFKFRDPDVSLSDDDCKRLSVSCQTAWDASETQKLINEDFIGFCIAQDLGEWIGIPIFQKSINNTDIDAEGNEVVLTRIDVDLLNKLHKLLIEYAESEKDIEIWEYTARRD